MSLSNEKKLPPKIAHPRKKNGINDPVSGKQQVGFFGRNRRNLSAADTFFSAADLTRKEEKTDFLYSIRLFILARHNDELRSGF